MRIGVVGAGVIGRLRARSVWQNARTTLVGVMDPSPGAAQRVTTGTTARPVSDLEALLDLGLDAVIVSSPPHVHETACVQAFARGCHVLCEKPLANSVEASRRIVDAALAAKRALGVGFNLRYYPAIRFVKEAIEQRTIGTLDHLRVFGGHEGVPKFRVDWQYKAPESGGGAMWDVGIHMTDVARYLLGEITEVSGMMSERVWNVPGSEDNALAVLRNPEGIGASYQATWTEWKGYQFYVEAYGSHGMARGAYAPMQNTLITMDQPGGRTRTTHYRYPETIVRERLFTWHDTALRSFAEELDDFIGLCEGRRDGRIADGFAGLRAAEVADAVKFSSTSRQVVLLPVLGRMPA